MNTLPYTLAVESISGAEVRARALFPAAYMGFQGHFPGKPILPGFLHVQLALDVLRAAGLPHALREVSGGKFSRPILPEAEVQIVLTANGGGMWDAKLMQREEPVSAFTLAVE